MTAQAESAFRLDPKNVLQIRVRNSNGDTVPLGSFTTVRDIAGPYRVPRYNLYPAAELDGAPAPGYSQGQAIQIMQKLAAETLPEGFSYEWTSLPSSSCGRATPQSLPSCLRWCSCSWCWPPNTKA